MSRAAAVQASYRHWRIRIFGVTWLAYAGLYLTRKAFPVVKNELKKPGVLGLTNVDLSWIDAANSLAYTLGQFWWGAQGDRSGTRAVVLLGMAGSVAVSMLCGWSTSVTVLAVLLALQGWFQSCGWAPLCKNMGEFFSRSERGTVMGFWCTNYAFGGFIASAVAGWAAQQFGWRWAFFVPAGGLGVVWLLFFLLQRNRPEDVGLPPIERFHSGGKGSRNPADAGSAAAARRVVGQVLRNPMVWLLAGVYFLIKPTRYLILYWSPVYLHDHLGTGTAESGILASVFDLAGPVGTLVGGLLSDRVFRSKRMPVAILSLFLLAGCMAAFPFLPVTRLAVGAGLFVIGFLIYIPDSLVSGVAAIDFGTRRGASTATGLINGLGSAGQIIGVALPGLMGSFLAAGADIWPPIFISLGASLLLAGLVLLPQWNRVPTGR